MGSDYNAIGGIKDDEMEQIRRLRGEVQSEVPSESISIKDAVLWAVNNELERGVGDDD